MNGNSRGKEPLKYRFTPLQMLVFIFILISSVKILFSLNMLTPFIFADEAVYDNIAHNIIIGKFYSTLQYCQTYPPGYPIMISIPYLLSSDANAVYHLMLVINAMITSSIIFPIYLILKRYTSQSVAIITSALVATIPQVTSYTFFLLSENLFITLFVFSILFFIIYAESNSKFWALLCGFTIGYLFVTRTMGIAMVIGTIIALVYYVSSVNKNERNARINSIPYMILPIFATITLWICYKQLFIVTPLESGLTTYDESIYLGTALKIFSNTNTILYSGSLLLHEIEYIAISVYLVFFIFTIFSLKEKFSNKTERERPLSIAIVYFMISAIIQISIAVLHMSNVIGNPQYIILGRYIDPIIPVIFILGSIEIYKKSGTINNLSQQKIAIFCLIFISAVLLIIFSFPYTNYKFGLMISSYYFSQLSILIAPWLIILALASLALVSMYIIYRSKKLTNMVLSIFIIVSIICSYLAYSDILNGSYTVERMNHIGRYIQTNFNSSAKIVIVDSSVENGIYTYFLTRYWDKVDTIVTDEKNLSNVLSKNSIDYIISSEIQPKKLVYMAPEGLRLYSNQRVNETIQLPYIIKIGKNDTEYIYNFHDSEEQFRWTKNSSQILILSNADSDIKLELSEIGDRPEDNPANLKVFVNGQYVDTVIIRDSGKYSIVVPRKYLNEVYQVVELDTNTFSPKDYGWNDNRDLGIAINKIVVDKAE